MMVTEPLVVNFGGGRNGTWLLKLMHDKGIMPDLIIFANTGNEIPEVYQWIPQFNRILSTWGFPQILTVHATREGKKYTLRDHCQKTGLLPSLAYGKKSCSQKFKAAPIDKFINNWPTAKEAWDSGRKVTRFIGYHSGERHRMEKVLDRNREDTKFSWFYPLIEWGVSNEDCKNGCKDMGWVVSKSACYFCPATKKGEILRLKQTHPDLFNDALQMEKEAQSNHRVPIGLGGKGLFWENVNSEDNSQMKLWSWLDKNDPTPVPCGCFD